MPRMLQIEDKNVLQGDNGLVEIVYRCVNDSSLSKTRPKSAG